MNSACASARSPTRPCSSASRRCREAARWCRAAAISRRRSTPRCARRRAGSAASRWPDGNGWAGAAGSASAGCGCATGAGRSPRCCWSRAMPRSCCGCSCGSPRGSARRSTLTLSPLLAFLLKSTRRCSAGGCWSAPASSPPPTGLARACCRSRGCWSAMSSPSSRSSARSRSMPRAVRGGGTRPATSFPAEEQA